MQLTIIKTVEEGEGFAGRFGRMGFRRNFTFGGIWRGKAYQVKQVEVYAVKEQGSWVRIIVMARYF